MLSYILTSIIAYLGLVAGIIIIHFAKEEQKAGMPYFLLFQNLLACISVSFLVFFLGWNIFINISLTFLALLVLFLIKSVRKAYYIYPILGLFLFLAYDDPSHLAIQASLVFLLGLPTSALLYNQKDTKKSIFRIIVFHLGFFILAIVPLAFKVLLWG
jgi:hypothetical protein